MSDEWESASPAEDFKKARRKKAELHAPAVDRLPPHSIEAEQGVLGCILLCPVDSIGVCIDKLPSGSLCFYDLRHQTIYGTVLGMYEKNIPIDTITVFTALSNSRQLEAVGGVAYLSSLVDTVPSAANIGHYLEIVMEKYALRKSIIIGTDLVSRAYEHTGEVDALIEQAELDIRSISDGFSSQQALKSASSIILQVQDTIDKAITNKGQLQGIPTGFADFDHRSCGLMSGEMVVIAARPSVGKSAMSMNIAVNISKTGKPVMFFSLEMTAESLMMRAICSESNVAMNNVRSGNVNDNEIAKLGAASALLAKLKLFIDDSGGLSVMQVGARARLAKQLHGIQVVIIDYLQLMHSTKRRWQSNQEEVSDISRTIKYIAKDLAVPVVVLSQLNREVEGRPDGKPRLSDLRDSGSIEQDADVVALLYNHKQTEEDQALFLSVGLITAKSRNGPTGEDTLVFLKPYSRFESAAKVSDMDYDTA